MCSSGKSSFDSENPQRRRNPSRTWYKPSLRDARVSCSALLIKVQQHSHTVTLERSFIQLIINLEVKATKGGA